MDDDYFDEDDLDDYPGYEDINDDPLEKDYSDHDDIDDLNHSVLEDELREEEELDIALAFADPPSKSEKPQKKTVQEKVNAVTPSLPDTSAVQRKNLQAKVMIAVRRGYLGVLQQISKSLPSFNFSFRYHMRSKKYTTPLLCSCKFNQEEIVQWLLPKVNKQEKTKAEETPLILAVSNTEVKMEMIHNLLIYGEQNLGHRKKHKMTAVHIACKEGHVEVVELLLQFNKGWQASNAPPKILDRNELGEKNGNTPFMLAVCRKSKRHKDIVKLWLEMEEGISDILKTVSVDTNEKKFNAVMIAAHHGMLEYLKIMEDFKGISDTIATMKTTSGWNIIHCTVASGSLETLEWLLTTRPTVLLKTELLDEPSKKGYTPLLIACEYHHADIVQYLVELSEKKPEIDININAKTNNGMTALHLAAMHDAWNIVDFLLKYEFDILAQEQKHGYTVLHMATIKTSLRVENRLKDELEYENLKTIVDKNGKTAEDVRNPVHIPLEIQKRGDQSVKAFLEALLEGKAKNNHCNLVVLGEERVGKTSLIKAFLGKDFDPECKSTQGVQIDQIETVAERVDIILPDDSSQIGDKVDKVWEAVNPSDRVKDHFAESVVEAMTEADPKPKEEEPEDYDDDISEVDLMSQVDDIVKELKPLEQRRSKPKKRKSPRTDSGSQSKKKKYQKSQSAESAKTRPPAITSSSYQDDIDSASSQTVRARGSQRRYRGLEPAQSVTTSVRESISYSDSKAIAKKMKQRSKKGANLIFHAIDFAGQALYRPMHHCFITHRAVYIIVFKLTEMLKHIRGEKLQKDPIREVQYWLNNIIAHASIKEESQEDKPKIFLVGTHRNGDHYSKDTASHCGPLSDEDVEEVNEKLMNKFIMNSEDMKYRDFIQFTSSKGGYIVFAVENSITSKKDEQRSSSGIHQLMSRISEIRDKISFLRENFPTSYIKFEQKLLEMQEKRKDCHLSTRRGELTEWAVECGITEEEGIKTAIQFYHDIRVIIDQSLISSPFKDREISPEDDLVFLSPQWLGSIMCKIVELKVGSESHDILRMIAFQNSGVILKDDLQKCLLGPATSVKENEAAYDNLLKILESYCLIFRLTGRLYKLLKLDQATQTEQFLVPCRMRRPDSVSPFPKQCYKFEFQFQSYLPQEVYVHCLCVMLSKMGHSSLPSGSKQKLELFDSCSVLSYLKLMEDSSLADWKIEMDNERHALIFSVCPHDDVYQDEPSQYIIVLDECVLNPVCTDGSLGCLAYTGGPLVKCSCVGDDQTIMLPYVSYSPDSDDNGSPDTPSCMCKCNHNKFNVDEVLKQQVTPEDSQQYSPSQPTTVINIGAGILPTNQATRSAEQQSSGSVRLSQHDPSLINTNRISHSLLVKTAEVFHDKGRRVARYLNMTQEWKDIKKRPPSDDDMDDEEIDIDRVQSLLVMWANNKTETKLREVLRMMDKDRAAQVFDYN